MATLSLVLEIDTVASALPITGMAVAETQPFSWQLLVGGVLVIALIIAIWRR